MFKWLAYWMLIRLLAYIINDQTVSFQYKSSLSEDDLDDLKERYKRFEVDDNVDVGVDSQEN